jgi:GNAT superfamily N-acetyltransferase
MGPTVRPAAFEDVFHIERTLRQAQLLADLPTPPIEVRHFHAELKNRIAYRLIWVAEADQRVVGCLSLTHHYWPWNAKAFFLGDDWFWVEPQHRKGGTAKNLLDKAKACARDLHVPLFLTLSFGGMDVALKDRFAKMQGFTYKGGRFCFDPQSESSPASPFSLLPRAAE